MEYSKRKPFSYEGHIAPAKCTGLARRKYANTSTRVSAIGSIPSKRSYRQRFRNVKPWVCFIGYKPDAGKYVLSISSNIIKNVHSRAATT